MDKGIRLESLLKPSLAFVRLGRGANYRPGRLEVHQLVPQGDEVFDIFIGSPRPLEALATGAAEEGVELHQYGLPLDRIPPVSGEPCIAQGLYCFRAEY